VADGLKGFTLKKPQDILYFLGGIGVVAGLILSIISWLKLCSEACLATHSWRFCGCEFENIGITFFPILTVIYLLGWKNPLAYLVAGWMVAGALGSEVMFIFVQKYKIGHWCPICLSIAASMSKWLVGSSKIRTFCF